MNKEPVIKVENVSKKFSKSLRRGLAYGTYDLFRNFLGLRSYNKRLRRGEFWSLEDINFEVYKGETFGLVGANGSGKSTLLRLLNGIFPPDKGKITVKGRMGALIAVGAGFHPYMTGRENIYLNGTILGMTKEKIEERFQSIIDFAEIGEFIDAPVSTYSSGMYVRLGFAIAIHSNPDIVLLDEILSVGDAKFQRKCLDKIKEMRESGVTFIIVSHNMQNIESMCDRALLIHKGKQIMLDSPRKIIPVYELMLQTNRQPEEFIENISEKVKEEPENIDLIFQYPDFGTDEITVNNIRLVNEDNVTTKIIHAEKPFNLEIDVTTTNNLDKSILFLTFNFINDKDDMDKNFVSLAIQERISIPEGGSVLKFNFDQAQLTTGEYSIGVFIFDETYTNPYTQGYYGYFTSKSQVSTMLRVGHSTPFCWIKPSINITKR